MAPDVSRALARFIARMGLGQAAARELVSQYGATQSAANLPDWLTEQEPGETLRHARFSI